MPNGYGGLHEFIDRLNPVERKILSWALADQDRLIDRQGEVEYYRNVTTSDSDIVKIERIRQSILGEM